MRITNALFYNNSVNDYQRNMQELHKTNQQISSGRVIQHSFQDSGKYVDTMRLDYEVETLEQIKETSSKAQTFANNTDKTLNQITSILDQFKTKLIQSANESNSATSLNALANDLDALKTNLISVGNTSINGQFLFSGSALNVKPINEDGSYNGNNETLEALIGSGVQIPYNVTGTDLFLGKDSDYNRMLSTNIKMFDQTKLHPEVMTGEDTESAEAYLNSENTIRDMVGDTDDIKTNDPDTVFYLSGKKPEGETFSTSFQLSSGSKVSDLMERIGQEYGNTSTNKVVNVQMNPHGQIEITDLKKGNTLLEMNLFGAVDREAAAGVAGNADITSATGVGTDDIDELLGFPNVNIIEFTKSNFDGENTASQTASKENIFTPGTFRLGYPMSLDDGSSVSNTTLLRDFMGSTLDTLTFAGSDDAGGAVASPADDLAVGAATTVQDLLNHIESTFETAGGNVTARLENGQIIVEDNTLAADPSFGDSNLSITMDAEAGGNPLNAFQTPDGMNYDRRGFVKEGNELLGNVSQTIKDSGAYAIANTKLIDVAGVDTFDADISVTTDDTQLILNGKNKDGNPFTVQIDMTNTTGGATFSFDNGVTNYAILNSDGDPTKADDVTYQQLMDIVSYASANTIVSKTPEPIATSANLGDIATAIAAGTPTQAQLDAATAGTISQNTKDYILEAIDYGIAQAAATDPIEIASLDTKKKEALSMADATHYGDIMRLSQSNVEVSLDYKGRMEVIDRKNSKSDIELALYDANNADDASAGSVLSFMANNAVTIEDPNIDFYKDLDEMIDAVRSGTFRMDADSNDPRNIGIQNSLRRLDHLSDHITKEHTRIGSYSNALMQAQERSELLSLNVKDVRSDVIDVDIADAYMRFQQLTNSYQASLSTISKINSMSLLNYM